MKNIIIPCLGFLFFCLFISCEEEILDQEQYRNVLYLKSDGNNIFSYTHRMNDSITTGYITVGTGGSLPLNEDIALDIVLDTSILNRYNFRNYGLDSAKYVQMIRPNLFALPSEKIIIKKGDPNMTTFFPIEIDANLLSPDTTYMIPFRLQNTANYEINELKNFIFYKPELENEYSSPKLRTYRMKGIRTTSNNISSAMTLTKNILPLAYNRVRLYPDNLAPSTSVTDIQNKAIVLIIDKDHNIKIKPFKHVEVEADGENYYNSSQKTFHLNYRYKQAGQSTWIKVQETLTRVE